MRLEPIERSDDPRLEIYRDVRDPAWMTRRGIFLAEGREVVRALLMAEGFRARSVVVTEPARGALADVLARAPENLPVYRVSPAVLAATSGVRFHQGCVAAAERTQEPSLEALLADARLLLVLADVTNPDNVGASFRNAAAFGVNAVLLSPRCAWPLYRKAVRTSMGAALQIPFAELAPHPDALATLRARGFELLALDPRGPLPLADLEPGERVALLLGNEGEGLAPELLAHATHRVRIEMTAGADSLNVATAGAIALYQLARRLPGSPGLA